MRISKRGEYGLRAMIRLAQRDGQPNPFMQIKVVAERENIPLKFLEAILLQLKNAGLLHSQKGPGGGYALAHPAGQISISSIIRTLDGPLAPVKCVSKMAYEPCDCPDQDSCGVRLVMADVRTAIVAILDSTSLADLAGRVAQQKQIHPLGGTYDETGASTPTVVDPGLAD